MKLEQERVKELQVLKWIDHHTVEQSARLYYKFNNTRGSDDAQPRSGGGGCFQVGAMTIEIGHVAVRHNCSINDGMKG